MCICVCCCTCATCALIVCAVVWHLQAVAVCFKIGCLTTNTLLFHVIPGLSYKGLQLIATGNPSSYLMGNGG